MPSWQVRVCLAGMRVHYFCSANVSGGRRRSGMGAGDALVCVVWPHTAPNFPALPQRLGIVYCFNRPCALYAVAAPGTSAERAGDSDEVCEVSAHLRAQGRAARCLSTHFWAPAMGLVSDDAGPFTGQMCNCKRVIQP